MGNWICTDPDDLQYQRKIDDDHYEMVGIVATVWDDDHFKYYVTHEFMHVADYEEDALELATTYGYVNSMDDDWRDALSEYDDPVGIMLEMAFETYGFEDDGKKIFHSFEDAEKYVCQLVS